MVIKSAIELASMVSECLRLRESRMGAREQLIEKDKYL